MKEKKNFGPDMSIFEQHKSECMISNISKLLFAHSLYLLVCFPLIQLTQVSKLVKSKVSITPSFTSLLIL